MAQFPWLAHYQKGIPAEIDPDFVPSIPALLDKVAGEYPDHAAFISMGQKLTYSQVAAHANDLAAFFQSLPGMEKGDRIAIMMPNILQYPVTLFGVLTVAMVPGVVVAYYTEYLKIKEKETVSTFLEKLERLPELSKEELTELSERVKQFNAKK